MLLSVMKGLLAVTILSTVVNLVSGINCHSCQYALCADPYDKSDETNLGDCGDDMYCVKYKTIVWIQDSGEINGNFKESSVVTRTCESKKGQKEGCVGWENNGGVTLKCWCGTDGCNSGRSLRSTYLSVAVAVVLGLLMTARSLYH